MIARTMGLSVINIFYNLYYIHITVIYFYKYNAFVSHFFKVNLKTEFYFESKYTNKIIFKFDTLQNF